MSEQIQTIAGSIRALGAKLKSMVGCAASQIEGQPCMTMDVRFVGRELTRMADRIAAEEGDAARRAEEAGAELDALRERLTAAEAKAARLEARKVAMCSCVDYRIHCKGGDTQYCQSGHDHETVGPRDGCKKCKGSGAVIVEAST